METRFGQIVSFIQNIKERTTQLTPKDQFSVESVKADRHDYERDKRNIDCGRPFKVMRPDEGGPDTLFPYGNGLSNQSQVSPREARATEESPITME